MRFLIILILSLIALSSNAQIIKSNAIMELNNMDFSTPCSSCSEWRYSRNTNFLYRWNGTSWIIYNPGSTLNLGLSMPGIFNVSPSTLTGSGTFNVTLNSQAQNTFLAAPSNASGVPTFRTLTPSDLSVAGGLSGTSSAGRVAFYTGASTLTGDANLTWDNSDKSLSLGGSGVSSSLLTLNSTTRGILIPRMTTTEKNAIVAPATGLLVYDLTLGAFNVYNGSAWVSVGGGLPAGSNGQIQFNNNNVFGASSNLFWDNTDSELGVGTTAPTARVHIVGTGTTNATSPLMIQNSTPTTILQVLDNGRIHQTIPNNLNTTIFGTNAGASLASPTGNNTLYGNRVGESLTTGHSNTLIGNESGRNITVGSHNIVIGSNSGTNITGSIQNVIIGNQSALSYNNSNGVLVGYFAGRFATGGNLTLLGASSGISTTGSNNTFLGVESGINNTTGANNVLVGAFAGKNTNAGANAAVISSSVLIGDDTRVNASGETNQIVIGQGGRGLGSNTTVLGNSSTVQTWLGGNVTVGTTSIGARLSVAGSGSDNNASSLLIQNSLARTLFSVRNDGLAQLGRNTAVAAQSVAQVEVVSDDTNTGLVLTPKGTGAIIAGPAPDGSTAGGNARGANAVDLQTTRTAATQVASGLESVIGGGRNNTASGERSVVIGGTNNNSSGGSSIAGGISNTASGNGSVAIGQNNTASTNTTVAIGNGNLASNVNTLAIGWSNTASAFPSFAIGASNTASASESTAMGYFSRTSVRAEFAMAGGQFATAGDAQFSNIFLRAAVTGQSQTELFTQGSGKAVLPANRVWNVNVQCSAVVNDAGNGTVVAGDALVQTFTLGIKRIGTSTLIMGNNASTQFSAGDTNMAGANFTVDADDANEALRIQFTPPTAAGTTTVTRCHCVAKAAVVGF